MITASNFTLSELFIGEELIATCPVESCIENIQVLIFKGSELVSNVTVKDPSTEVAQFNLAVSQDIAGEYKCQTLVSFVDESFSFNASFNITGKFCYIGGFECSV